MAGDIATFSPDLVYVTFRGYRIGPGFVDGTMIKCSRNEDSFTRYTGTDGKTCRIANADKSGRITLSLAQTAASNDILSQFAEQDELTKDQTGAVFVTDTGGTTRVHGAEAWIVKPPDIELGKSITERTWIIEVGHMTIFSGGNNLIPA